MAPSGTSGRCRCRRPGRPCSGSEGSTAMLSRPSDSGRRREPSRAAVPSAGSPDRAGRRRPCRCARRARPWPSDGRRSRRRNHRRRWGRLPGVGHRGRLGRRGHGQRRQRSDAGHSAKHLHRGPEQTTNDTASATARTNSRRPPSPSPNPSPLRGARANSRGGAIPFRSRDPLSGPLSPPGGERVRERGPRPSPYFPPSH